eukprot:Tbor_TRINITY_DN3171_c0_g1::TRINITY_DN3171_c0_g1_i1::g.14690::m.14690
MLQSPESLEGQLLALIPRIASMEQELKETKIKYLSLEEEQKTMLALVEQNVKLLQYINTTNPSQKSLLEDGLMKDVNIHSIPQKSSDGENSTSLNNGKEFLQQTDLLKPTDDKTNNEERIPCGCQRNTMTLPLQAIGHPGDSNENITVSSRNSRISAIENNIISLMERLGIIRMQHITDNKLPTHHKEDIAYIKENYVPIDFMNEILSAVDGKLLAVMSSVERFICDNDSASMETRLYNMLVHALKSDIQESAHNNSDNVSICARLKVQDYAIGSIRDILLELVRNELKANFESNTKVIHHINEKASKVAREAAEAVVSTLNQKLDFLSNRLVRAHSPLDGGAQTARHNTGVERQPYFLPYGTVELGAKSGQQSTQSKFNSPRRSDMKSLGKYSWGYFSDPKPLSLSYTPEMMRKRLDNIKNKTSGYTNLGQSLNSKSYDAAYGTPRCVEQTKTNISSAPIRTSMRQSLLTGTSSRMISTEAANHHGHPDTMTTRAIVPRSPTPSSRGSCRPGNWK